MKTKTFPGPGEGRIESDLFQTYFKKEPKLDGIKIFFISDHYCSFESARTEYPFLEFALEVAKIPTNLVFVYHSHIRGNSDFVEEMQANFPELESFQNIIFVLKPVSQKEVLDLYYEWLKKRTC